MILKFSFLIIPTIFVSISGQKCTLSFGTDTAKGYCREKDDCFGPSQEKGCSDGLVCCDDSQKSVSAEKCREYGQYVYKRTFNGALTARAVIHNVSECHIEATPLIVGGLKTNPKEFPHMVAIGYGNDIKNAFWLCGGSLISKDFVLSAAHCSQSEGRWPAKFARLGTSNLKNAVDAQDILIVEIINHPKYKPPSRYNDIALYKLATIPEINGYVRPACLHTSPEESDFKKVLATGWGKTDYNAIKGSEELLKVTLDFIDYSTCNNFFAVDVGGRSLPKGIISSQVCAGVLSGGKDTCQGDSGGPIQITLEDPYCMYSIVGVTSFGKFCGFKNSPAVYTKISYYVPWIESIVWAKEEMNEN